MTVGWALLFISVLLEIAWASTLKATEGYTRLLPSLLNFTLNIANLLVLSKAMKYLPAALAYSIWTGLGTVGVTLVAIYLNGELINIYKVLFIVLIITGVIGLKLTS